MATTRWKFFIGSRHTDAWSPASTGASTTWCMTPSPCTAPMDRSCEYQHPSSPTLPALTPLLPSSFREWRRTLQSSFRIRRLAMSNPRLPIAIAAVALLLTIVSCSKDPQAQYKFHMSRADKYVQQNKLPEALVE